MAQTLGLLSLIALDVSNAAPFPSPSPSPVQNFVERSLSLSLSPSPSPSPMPTLTTTPPASPSPASPTPTPMGWTTTPGGACSTPLCQGLVGAAGGIAGLAAIGGIVAATVPRYMPKPTTKQPTIIPTRLKIIPTTLAPATTRAPTTTLAIRKKEDRGSSGVSSWLWVVLLGLFALGCCVGLLVYFCLSKRKKTAKKGSRMSRTIPTSEPVVAPEPEQTPLLGNYGQPMMNVPASTTALEYSPVVDVVPSYLPIAAPAFGVTPTVAPMYGYEQTASQVI